MSTQSLTEEIYQVIKDSEAIGGVLMVGGMELWFSPEEIKEATEKLNEIDTLGLDEYIHRTMTGYLGHALE